jgi:hypothetical protein
MRNLYSIIQAKSVPITARVALFIALTLGALAASAQTATFISSGSLTVPAGVTSAKVYIWGGGGGGGGTTKNNPNWYGNGGGGGGGACTVNTVIVSSGQTYTITIGTSGTGGTTGGAVPTAGGITTVSGPGGTFTAGGGAPGTNQTSTATNATAAGGVGGNTGTGTIFNGGNGSMGNNGNSASTGVSGTGGGAGGAAAAGTSPASACGVSGTGGAGIYTGGNGGYNSACSTTTDQAGSAGTQPGGGGSGNNTWGTRMGGGNGGAGEVIIVYTIALPTISSFTPTSGCAGSLPLVTITGTNFTGVTSVLFNGTAVASYSVVNATTITATPAAGTTSGMITVTTAAGTATSGSAFTVNPAPTTPVTVSGGGTFCGSAVLTATGGTGGTIYWEGTTSGGTSTATPSSSQVVSTSGTYYFNASVGSCWGTQGSAIVTINPVPAAPTGVTATASTICNGATSQLNATSAGNTISWWTASAGGSLLGTSASGANFAVTPASTTTYYAESQTLAACASTTRVPVTVTVNSAPSAVIVATPGIYCGSTTLTASGGTGGVMYWENTTNGGTSTATPSSSQLVSASGTYYFSANNTCGWTQGSATVTINALPAVAAIGGANAVCTGSTIALTDATLLGSWSASNGSATVNALGVVTGISAGIDTIYYTTVAAPITGCTNNTSKIITVNPIPSAAITPASPSTFCGPGILTASGGGTYLWNGTGGGATTAGITASASGTYVVTVTTTATGCTASAANNVTINPMPASPTAVTATPATICNGQSSNLKANSAGGSVGWWTAATGGSLLGFSASGATFPVIPASTTTYYAEASSGGCVSAARVAVTVTVNPVPAAVIVSGGTTQCGGTVTLTASGGTGGTIYWENTTSGGTSIATPSSSQSVSVSGTYYFNALQGSCWGTQGSTVVTINAVPAAPTSVTASPSSICTGQSSKLNATSAGNSINWWTASSGGSLLATVASGANYNVSPASTTIYYAEAYTPSGCASATRVAVTVTVTALPVVPAITGSANVCAGSTTALSDGTAGGVWSSSNTPVATISTAGVVTGVAAGIATISYTVTNGAGCITTVTTTVTVNALPTPTANNAVSCSGAVVTLTATSGGTYLWSTGATSVSITTSTAGPYAVTVTNGAGCNAIARDTVTNSTPAITVNNPATCAGGTNTLTVSGAAAGSTYLWSTSATTVSITTTVAGVYSVTATNASGCTASASGISTVNALPTPSVDNITICAGSLGTLTANSGVIYVWSNGSHAATTTVSAAGIYTVTVTNSGSCTAVVSDTVTVTAAPTASATSASICSGSPATLTASGGSSYIWSTGATTTSISTVTAGTYTVTATNASGCTASANGTATNASNPTPSVNNAAICAGGSATLTASGGATYIWSTGATTTSITVSPATTTTYTVTATNAAGCSAAASGTVTVNPLPIASATSASVCSGTAATLTASGGGTYLWSNGANTANISVTPLVTMTYTVTVTNAFTCSATASGTATPAIKPVPSVNSATGCKNTAVTLTATVSVGGPCTYLWSNGATTASISVSPATTTTYTVTATNAAGCTASANGTATVYPLPTVAATSNSPVLLNSTINLTATPAAGTPFAVGSAYNYSWSGPSAFTNTTAAPSIASATPANGGVYTVTVSDAHACIAIANTTVILNFTSPGGITSNDALWLMANTGVNTAGANVTTWNDQSGLINNATIVNGTASSVTLVNNSINSYPIINFGGAGGLQGAFGSNITSTSVSAFIVSQVANASLNASGEVGICSTGGVDHSSTNSAVLFQRIAATSIGSVRNSATDGNYTNANAMGQYHLLTSIYSGPSAIDNFYHEGAAATSAAYPSTAFNAALYTIGSRSSGGVAGNYLTGQIAEVVLCNTQLSLAQKNQIESYLATKYGFTLDQTTATNYVASNSQTFWNAASNGTYKNNIFGVGIDNISTLSQTQSVSINTNLLSINNAVGLSYYSFLMVSDNAAGNTVTSRTNLPNTINADLATVWRVSQTGSRASANYVYNSTSTNFGYYAPIAASMSVYMLIDSNADGVYESYLSPITSIPGSSYTFNTNLNDGALFTFGFKASIDFGDAPTVPTLMSSNGAGHMIVPGVRLGALIDAELDGQPSFNSLGDDTIGLADEDGVNFNIGVPTSVNIVTMGSNSISVTASVPGYLNAWADFNQDGSYGGGSEYAIQNIHLVAGANIVTFNVSDSVEYGPTSMRFRFAQGASDVTSPTGLATNGEVEDYKIYVTAPLVGPCTNGFQNPGFEQGPMPAPNNYIITSEINLPYWRTTATDHMIESWYSGFNGVPSHGGTYFVELEANLYGALYQDVYTTPGTKLIWSFAHRGRAGSDTAQLRIGAPGATVYQTTAIDNNTAWGVHSGYYTVPAGQYITRLEFWAIGSYGGNNSIGNFLDDVSVASSFDYGDAPNSYGTLFASNGPYHSITGNLYLGAGETCDGDGQPSVAANLDSLDDGVTFPAACASCNIYTVNINAYNNTGSPATIAGWIDFNKNGVFDAAERTSITIPASAATQSVSMTFTVSAFSATSAGTYARFRIANDSTEISTPYGLATSGEVEDYKVPCVAVPTPVPTATPTPTCARGPLNLTATGSAPSYSWTGPNGFTSNLQNPTLPVVPSADSGIFRVYAVYANGCETDSGVKVTIVNCFINLSGNIFDDANGDGIVNGTDVTTDLGQTIYAVLSDNTNTVLATTLIAANGGFSFTKVPAYFPGMTIVASITNPATGGPSSGPHWPANWVGTKEEYGTNNLAGSGVDNTPNLLPVSTGIANITNALLGFDQLPTTTPKTYTIPYPHMNSQKTLTPGNGLGLLAGSDPEDGAFTLGSTFTITSLAGMNGNTLYYDANGDGVLQSYEQITGYTTITNFDPTKLIIRFTGSGSTQASFNYGSTDAAGQVDPAPAPYVIKWVGTLPVKMLYFTGDKLGETQSLLKWATASEIDNDHFEIQRSPDAQSWEKIGEEKGAGTTDITTSYTMTDAEPLTGVNYYRLKQVDVDGHIEYSEMAQVTFNDANPLSNAKLSVYPNPLNQASKLNIELASATETISEVMITNAIGQTVYTTLLPEIQSYQVFGLNLPSGVYIVSVRTQTNSMLTSRLVITH